MITEENSFIGQEVIVTLHYTCKLGSNTLVPVDAICTLVSIGKDCCVVREGNDYHKYLNADVYHVYEKLGIKAKSKEAWNILAQQFIDELQKEINNDN